jgi:uncharacterized protein (DUF1684 family)
MNSISKISIRSLFLLLFFVSCESSAQTTVPVEDTLKNKYEEQINAWHARRISSLKNDNGWLTLIAREWLKEGPNKFADVGTITLKQGKVTVQLYDTATGTMGGKPFSSGAIRTGADTGGPDKVKFGTRAFVIIKRGDRFALRMWDSNAENRKNFTGVDRYPVLAQWRVEARWEEYRKPKMIQVPTVVEGYVEDYSVPGAAVFNVDGKVVRLEPVVEPGSEELFFIFADGTSGRETYGGGRFLYAAPAKDGVVVLDFNKAINPPCAFTPFATCPLPPASNRLTVRIEAGEKKYGDH